MRKKVEDRVLHRDLDKAMRLSRKDHKSDSDIQQGSPKDSSNEQTKKNNDLGQSSQFSDYQPSSENAESTEDDFEDSDFNPSDCDENSKPNPNKLKASSKKNHFLSKGTSGTSRITPISKTKDSSNADPKKQSKSRNLVCQNPSVSRSPFSQSRSIISSDVVKIPNIATILSVKSPSSSISPPNHVKIGLSKNKRYKPLHQNVKRP